MNAEKIEYPKLDGFANVYLEDSFVLQVKATPGYLAFDVELVLTPQHPAYHPPAPGEQACYARATIEFPEVRNLVWSGQGTPPAVDASGSKDYGGIDALFWTGSAFHLEGDWGAIDVASALPVIRLLPET
ncbi:hypothetical protein [Streptomyces sp. TLI_185]|uniref:hypothetical protein n=1 Tax=Streptomyces sp. TLI_185 TaxID=2485151 RepID=UPI000F50730C|nr:hypothetical protein [Streptomyces sp. TLI_185]RPF35943.1 hypothetical protein EDD92_5968 [Streptomyces sp. TLI_185]